MLREENVRNDNNGHTVVNIQYDDNKYILNKKTTVFPYLVEKDTGKKYCVIHQDEEMVKNGGGKLKCPICVKEFKDIKKQSLELTSYLIEYYDNLSSKDKKLFEDNKYTATRDEHSKIIYRKDIMKGYKEFHRIVIIGCGGPMEYSPMGLIQSLTMGIVDMSVRCQWISSVILYGYGNPPNKNDRCKNIKFDWMREVVKYFKTIHKVNKIEINKMWINEDTIRTIKGTEENTLILCMVNGSKIDRDNIDYLSEQFPNSTIRYFVNLQSIINDTYGNLDSYIEERKKINNTTKLLFRMTSQKFSGLYKGDPCMYVLEERNDNRSTK